MMLSQQKMLSTILTFLAVLSTALAFAPSASIMGASSVRTTSNDNSFMTTMNAAPIDLFSTASTSSMDHLLSSSSSSMDSSTNLFLSLSTLDPTTFLSDALGGLLGSYAILAVPIIAALSIVAVIAWLIVGYANPADEDDL